MGHKTTVTLQPEVWLRLRNRSTRDGVSVSALINSLLDEALASGEAGTPPESIGAGSSDTDDLGTNARKHLHELVR